MDSLQTGEFISQLRPIIDVVEKKQSEQKEKRERGELFNVFEAFRIDHNELAWSSFIATLLDPNGSHGCGNVFLKSFPFLPENFDYNHIAEIKLEKGIGELDKEHGSGGRIDIFVQDTYGNTLIIENKIYASDQPQQLYRYWKYANSGKDNNITNFKILYLTLNGHNPDSSSTNGLIKDNHYFCISYKNDIIKWLADRECQKQIADKPKVAFIINQFNEIILKLNAEMEMNEETRKAITDAFGLSGNTEDKIKSLSEKMKEMPEVTKQMQFLLDQYQQERVEELMTNFLGNNIIKDGHPLSYWHVKAVIEKKGYKHICFSHDVEDRAIYISVLFDKNIDENLIQKSNLKKDPKYENLYIFQFDINDYNSAFERLQMILDFVHLKLHEN